MEVPYYESIIVPSSMVPYIKSLIHYEEYCKYQQSLVTSTILQPMNDNTYLIPPLPSPPAAPATASASAPASVIIPAPASAPVEQIQTIVNVVKKEPLLKTPPIENANMYYINRSNTKSNRHNTCIYWLQNKCTRINCSKLHRCEDLFKTRICIDWMSNSCKNDMVSCRYAHGYSDPYRQLNTIDRSSNTYIRERSRSRSRERK